MKREMGMDQRRKIDSPESAKVRVTLVLMYSVQVASNQNIRVPYPW